MHCLETGGGIRGAMESIRKRFNSYMGHKVVKSGGVYVKHPDLQTVHDTLYLQDGVHLTEK